jgi:hypothetical protein
MSSTTPSFFWTDGLIVAQEFVTTFLSSELKSGAEIMEWGRTTSIDFSMGMSLLVMKRVSSTEEGLWNA